ncbi:succinyl-CoA:glutarate CoA-transferase isoform X7 [Scleropages formosus]|uniref:succinyl-CoA:glutarate CoA-transferase isoform X7 n=1 Tax=Scleropages formosus TaxID=113540 RepID=UPI0010FAA8BC|nr:succinate--hydroxymethylglutarate CoA-transferase isoform X7 [Scleropages formosus]
MLLRAVAATRFAGTLRPGARRPPRLLRAQSSRASARPGEENIKPLDGIKVLDLTRVLAGPFASMILGDLGAEIIKVERPGYGQTGPMSQSPGYDSIASAVSGMMHITGPEDGEPVRPGVAMTDLATGLYTHGAIMAALLWRAKTGRGLHIDCNLLSSQVACLTHIAANYLNAGKEAKRWGTAHESIVPYQGFKTQDGYLIVAAGNNKQFARVCKVLNLSHLSDDPKYKTNTLRVQNRKELLQILSQRFSEKRTSEWLGKFEGTGVPCGPINNIQQVFSDAQVAHNDLIMKMEHPTAGKVVIPGPAVRFSDFKINKPTPPPLTGQHTAQVLREMLGYKDDDIEQLLKAGTVCQNKVR